MYRARFGDEAPARRSVDQLRGIEGVRVRTIYQSLAQIHGIPWEGRRYDADEWDSADIPNRAMSAGTACLYGLCEAAILAAGYAPAIGFLHRGRPLSFVYDIADLFKFDTVVPVAFGVAARHLRGDAHGSIERDVRIGCRDAFRKSNILDRVIPMIGELLSASGFDPPPDAPEAPEPSFQTETSGDDGHRG